MRSKIMNVTSNTTSLDTIQNILLRLRMLMKIMSCSSTSQICALLGGATFYWVVSSDNFVYSEKNN